MIAEEYAVSLANSVSYTGLIFTPHLPQQLSASILVAINRLVQLYNLAEQLELESRNQPGNKLNDK